MATVAVMLGIASVLFFYILIIGILAIIFGVLGWRNAFYGAPRGWQALSGLALGIFSVWLCFAFWTSPT